MTVSSRIHRAVVGALVAVLAACSSAAGPSTDTTPATAAEFPVTVGDLTLEARPERIVSLSPTATEVLWAVGAGAQVVAVDEYSTHPQEAAELGTALSGFEPNIEAISGYDPDLVIVSYDPGSLVEQLGSLGIPVFMAPAVADLDGVYAQIGEIGALTGNASGAASVVEDMRSRIDAAFGSTGVAGQTYFYELDDTLYSLTSRTFIGSLMGRFGLVNIADDVEEGNDYPQLSAEVVVTADPDWIFLADTKCCGQTAETVAARDGWSGLSAVANGRIVELDDDVASRWGPRIVELIEAVAAALAR
ncbi:MAG: ABC transporter substrate-binding protein [Acidobacteria bacterium]|nr:ABC transporter substrate-binding protein [Acidobacteriota bacterium]